MRTFNEFVKIQNKTNIKNKITSVLNILIELFTIPKFNESRAHDNSEKFWTDPHSLLYPWLKQHGINRNVELPAFAQGGAGRAYFIKPYVVKMSANRVEANVAKMIANRDGSPIVDVLYLSDNIYAILQHFVNFDIPSELRSAADYLIMIVDDYNFDEFPSDPNEQKQICTEILHNNDGDIKLLPYMLIILDVLIQLYKITGFKHDDFGPTNIGLYNGKIVFPDLGPNQGKGFDTLSSLSKIKQNREKLSLPKWKSI